MTDTLAVVTAVTMLSRALRSEMRLRPDETRVAIAVAIDAAVAAEQTLDALLVARTVWDMTRGTYSRAYQEVIPEHGPLISPVAAFSTHPDDLVALAAAGWSAGDSDILHYALVTDDEELSMVRANERWLVRLADRERRTCRVLARGDTAAEALAAFAERAR